MVGSGEVEKGRGFQRSLVGCRDIKETAEAEEAVPRGGFTGTKEQQVANRPATGRRED